MKIIPAYNEVYLIHRLIVRIEDSGSFSAGGYGGLAALTNGISLLRMQRNVEQENIGALPIKTNGDWKARCHDSDPAAFNTDKIISARWSFDKYSAGYLLIGNEREEIHILLQDNFTGLDAHTFLFQGEKKILSNVENRQ